MESVREKFTLTSVTINFLWTPLFAWLLANLFLSHEPALWIGFIMLMVTPCTDWYIIFALITSAVLRKKKRLEAIRAKTNHLPMIFLYLAIAAMFASRGKLLFAHLDVLWELPKCSYFKNHTSRVMTRQNHQSIDSSLIPEVPCSYLYTVHSSDDHPNQ